MAKRAVPALPEFTSQVMWSCMGCWRIEQNETLPGGERGRTIRAEGGSQAVWPGFPAHYPSVEWFGQTSFPVEWG